MNAAPSVLVVPSWFDTPEKIAALRAEAERWVHTPFFANSEACGRDGGVDCVRLLHGIFVPLGVVPRLTIPPQVMDWGDHADHSLLVEAFETWAELTHRFRCVWRQTEGTPPPVPLPGDVMPFNGGKVPHHGGLMLDGGQFVHALRPEGVYCMYLNAAVRAWRILGQLTAIYRPLPEGHP